MGNDAREHEASTRRDYVKYGGAVVGAGLLAGCTGEPDSTSEQTTTEMSGEVNSSAATESTTESAAETTESESGIESYSVSMEPMGEVMLESVPERWMAYFSTYGDMALALGRLDGLEGLVFTDNWPLAFYDYLPDVDVAFDDVPQLMGENSLDKEAFYEMDCDVHLMDPNFIELLADNWDEEDSTEIAANIGPAVGNSIRRRGEDWHDYRYYTLYEAFGKVADVFRERDRFEALATVHDELLADIRSKLPRKDERPTVGLLSINSDFEKGAFYAYPVHQGNGHKQYRDLRMRGAFDAVIDGSYAEWDYEQILEVDLDALLFQYGFSHVSTEEFERRMDAMRDDPVGSQLSAVQNDRLYRGGTSYQGPIINLFQTEAAAKQFYPDAFGKGEGLETFANENEQLFDRQRVADIINGDI